LTAFLKGLYFERNPSAWKPLTDWSCEVPGEWLCGGFTEYSTEHSITAPVILKLGWPALDAHSSNQIIQPRVKHRGFFLASSLNAARTPFLFIRCGGGRDTAGER